MFELQHKLQQSYGSVPQRMRRAEHIQYVKDMTLAAIQELGEALNETNWKPWSVSSRGINVPAYVGELVDVWHFLMNLMLAAGYDPADAADALYEGYLVKRGINEKRASEGYDDTLLKCPLCKRALDDPAVSCRVITTVDGITTNGFCVDLGRDYTLGYLELQRGTV